MRETVIYMDSTEVGERLAYFGIKASDIWPIVEAAIQARQDVTDDYAKNASGSLAYQHGLAAMTTVLRSKGWQKADECNLEHMANEQLGVRILYQNVDTATQDGREPKVSSVKGPVAERMVDEASPYLFEDMEAERLQKIEKMQNQSAMEAWFLCICPDGCAELSRPKKIVAGRFAGFNERIFIINSEDWILPEPTTADTDQGDSGIEPDISRKTLRDV